MTFIVSNKEHQEKIKELALPVFDGVEKLMPIFKANGDESVYNNVQNAILGLNKVIFVYHDNVPSWDLQEIQNALNKLIHSIPRKYRSNIKYEKLQNYFSTIKWTSFKNKVKHAANNIGIKLRMF